MRLPILAPLLLVAATIGGCGERRAAVPTVADAYVRLPAVPGRPAAAYFTIRGGLRADRLTAVAGPAPVRIELHESMMHGGMAGMAPLAGVDVPAGADVAFAPGGRHAMIFGLPAAAPGRPVLLRLRFGSGVTADIAAPAIAAGDPAPAAASVR